jgi:hypothetical protein
MRTILLFVLSFLFLNTNSLAQELPNTNILLFDLNQKTDSVFQFSNPKFLTGFNPNGYNNQPYFMSDDELYLAVQFPKDTTQTDIYALDIRKNVLTQITATVESEYSPTLVPNRGEEDSQSFFSCVRVEADEDNSQRLWKFPLDRSNNGQPVFNSIFDIGYHYWLNYREAMLFIVGNPHYLIVANTRDQSKRNVISHIGRCFQQMPNGDIAFVHKIDDTTWLLKRMRSRTYSTQLITAALPNSEDFAVLGDGTIIMASGTKVFKFNKAIDTSWLEIADFSYYGTKKISRIAINKAQDKIALVVE